MENSLYLNYAKQLDHSLRNRQAIEPLKNANLTLEDAYHIQKEGILLRLARGEKITGYKMGLTSQAKQTQMNISTPIFGVLTDQMEIKNKESFSITQFIHPKVEPEIAFILGKDLKGEVTMDQAWSACSGVCAALDIIDSRYIDFKFTLTDVIADNCSAGGYVLGPIKDPATIDLKNLPMDLSVNEVTVKKGNSNAILGNPINSLIMLARLLDAENSFIKAGSIVLSGASTDAIDLKPDLRIKNTAAGLGAVVIVV